ncbi:hypothetical protein [Leptobacterium sp. I13]|uniref:hypothetical protein n=1 Tax=Leptobacterium meishanense TaxID=3128904 RepID=UPI0030EBF561
MKKLLLIAFTVIFTFACSGVKKSQEALNKGNYDTTISIAVDKLQNNKTRKGNQPYIYQLEEAFAKAVDRDLRQIDFLKKDGNPQYLEEIYETYVKLSNRQELIKPLLPLQLQEKGKNAKFKFQDYTNHIIGAKNELSGYLYTKASSTLKNGQNKYDFRAAYDDFLYIDKINPDYKDTKTKMEEAHFKGVDFVKVGVINDTQMAIPKKLEEELLNFDTYGINDLWTVFHNNPQRHITYDYEMQIAFRDINITPEQIKEKQVIMEKQIKDGWEYLYDDDGRVVKDSLGNKIKIDKMVSVRCDFYEFTQFKAVQVSGDVQVNDLKTNQLLKTYPLSSEFVFEHIYADYDGDKRALDNSHIRLINNTPLQFPSNEQMIYDAGEDLKDKMRHIARRYRD